MKNIFEMFYNNLLQIFLTIITGLIGYIGVRIKNIYQTRVEEGLKKDIIEKTILYVEQTSKDLSCDEKKLKAKEKATEWLNEKKIRISDTELEILIESMIKSSKQKGLC